MGISFEELLDRLEKDDLKEIISLFFEKDAKVRDLVEEQVKASLDFDSKDVSADIHRILKHLDDYAFLEAGIVGDGCTVSDLYTKEKASVAIAESIFNEFYEKAELMTELGMMSEARAFIRAIAEGVRSCHSNSDSVILTISDEFPLRYADNLESYLNSDDILQGFGKR